MNNIIVNIKNLQKSYKKNIIVEDLNLKIYEGCIYGLLGHNGAGKTTTIRMILGLISPDKGEIEIFGQKFTSNREMILKDIGSMVETPSFYGNLTARENLKIVCLMKNINSSQIDETLDLVGLGDCSSKKVNKFSLGMKQRLGIATAIIGKPKLIILDEPVNGLDPEGIQEIRTLIKSLAKKMNSTFLISSHLLSEMELIADKVAIMKNGHVIYQGNLNDLMKNQVNKIILSVTELDKACKYLNSANIKFENLDNKIIINGTYNIEKISKQLFEHGIVITNLFIEKYSLEDIYLKMMKS